MISGSAALIVARLANQNREEKKKKKVILVVSFLFFSFWRCPLPFFFPPLGNLFAVGLRFLCGRTLWYDHIQGGLSRLAVFDEYIIRGILGRPDSTSSPRASNEKGNDVDRTLRFELLGLSLARPVCSKLDVLSLSLSIPFHHH